MGGTRVDTISVALSHFGTGGEYLNSIGGEIAYILQ